jgi:ribosome recycling factor
MDISTFSQSLADIKEHLLYEFSLIRTGRASISLLDSVRVNAYGSLMPLNQVSTMTVEDARTIKISAWDSSLIPLVEKALLVSDKGVTTSVSDGGVRVHFPELTGETREKMVKFAKEKHEDARIAVKNERNKIMTHLDTQKKNGELSEDETSVQKTKVEQLIADMHKEFDLLLEKKRTEIIG